MTPQLARGYILRFRLREIGAEAGKEAVLSSPFFIAR
jgi:hypothetical protein